MLQQEVLAIKASQNAGALQAADDNTVVSTQQDSNAVQKLHTSCRKWDMCGSTEMQVGVGAVQLGPMLCDCDSQHAGAKALPAAQACV
jgi:hypothetical protein